MNKVFGKTFTNQQVILDGHQYEKCDFESCTFVYDGSGVISFGHNTISSNCRFEFAGAAANTVMTMQAIYSIGDWGRKHILATFQTIAPDLKNLH